MTAIVEDSKCELDGVTPCQGPMCLMLDRQGDVRRVCKGHYEDLFRLGWR